MPGFLLLLALQVTASRPASPPPGDWPMPGRDHAATRFSPLDRITPANVRNLKVEWTFATGSLKGHGGSPLVVGGWLYLHTPHPVTVYAFDLEQPGAAPAWIYAPASRGPVPSVCCESVSRGLAWHPSGKLFVPLLPGDLAAIDARTGRELWRARVGDPRAGAILPGPPLVVGDVVIAGVAGGEFGVRGYLTGYDALTGKHIWRAYSTGPDTDVLFDGRFNPASPAQQGRDLGLSTWSGDAWSRGGGATLGGLSYDAELDLLFHGTGGPAPLNPLQRAGENKWTASLFARDPRTGRARWALQLTPRSGFGYDGSNESIPVNLTLEGRPARALVHFDQNGFAYTLDRATGRILVAEKFGPVNWARSVDAATGLPRSDTAWSVSPAAPREGVCPSIMGLKGQAPAAYSPATGLFYVPANNLCMVYAIEPAAFTPGRPFLGATVRITPGPGGNRGRLIGWNASRGAVAWEIREDFPLLGGAMATAGGVVFYGTLDGWLKAADASSGTELWRFKLPSGVVGDPVTFATADGRQHLAIVSGVGGWAGHVFTAGANAKPSDGLGTVGLLADLPRVTNPGGVLFVFGL